MNQNESDTVTNSTSDYKSKNSGEPETSKSDPTSDAPENNTHTKHKSFELMHEEVRLVGDFMSKTTENNMIKYIVDRATQKDS